MHLQILAITINPSLIGHDRYYEAGFGAPHAPTRSCPMGQKIFKNGQRTGSSGKHRIWCGIAEQKDVQPLRWSVQHWLLAPGSEVLLSGRFSTLPTLLRIFMLMMREIGERVLCGKRWNSVSLCCKRFEGSAAVDNAPPQKSSDIRLRIFCLWWAVPRELGMSTGMTAVKSLSFAQRKSEQNKIVIAKAGDHHECGILPFIL